MLGVATFSPRGWSFVLRQGLANLYRPDNRTLLLTLSLGLGTFLLLTIYLTRDVLLSQFRSIDANDQPNIFLFDIQPDQKAGVAELVRQLVSDHSGGAHRDHAPGGSERAERRPTF